MAFFLVDCVWETGVNDKPGNVSGVHLGWNFAAKGGVRGGFQQCD